MSAQGDVAFLFAGQGTQYVGMGAGLWASHEPARALLTRAEAILGLPLGQIILEGPEERLALTEHTQPAVLLLGIVHHQLALERGLAPTVLLGHSLGEYAAWVAAGSLALEDALRLVRLRGRLMQEAVPVGVGAMSAVVGAESPAIEALCGEVAQRRGEVLSVAIHNCPGNLVISGHASAVREAEGLIEARQLGAVKALSVSAPFHCALLEPAARGLAQALAEVEVRPNALRVIPNATGRVAEPAQDPAQIRAWLVEQVVSPVLWEDSLRAALALGVKAAVGLGPGTTARAHLKRVDRKLPLVCLDEERPGL